jgi:hypothetical protein
MSGNQALREEIIRECDAMIRKQLKGPTVDPSNPQVISILIQQQIDANSKSLASIIKDLDEIKSDNSNVKRDKSISDIEKKLAIAVNNLDLNSRRLKELELRIIPAIGILEESTSKLTQKCNDNGKTIDNILKTQALLISSRSKSTESSNIVEENVNLDLLTKRILVCETDQKKMESKIDESNEKIQKIVLQMETSTTTQMSEVISAPRFVSTPKEDFGGTPVSVASQNSNVSVHALSVPIIPLNK